MKLSDVTNQGRVFRAYSIFSGIQEFGLILGYISILTYFYFNNGINKLLKFIPIFFFIIGIILTAAKSVWLSLFLSIVLFKLKLTRFSFVMIVIFLIPTFGILFIKSADVFTVVQFVRSHFPSSISVYIDPATLLPRLQIIQIFFDSLTFDYKLLFGQGMGSSRGLERVTYAFDNTYLFLVYEYGIIGLFTFFYIIFKCFHAYSLLSKNAIEPSEKVLLETSFLYIVTLVITINTGQTLAIRTIFMLFCFSVYYVFHLRNKYLYKQQIKK